MDLLHSIIQLDKTVFQWLNSGLSNPVFDALLPWMREKWIWAPLYVFLAAFFFYNFKQRTAWLLVLGLIVSAGVSDFTSSTLIKKYVIRLRPCNDPEMQDKVVLRIPCGSGYSFTSSHASNHFAVAVFLMGVFTAAGWRKKYLILLWAGVISFSQIYMGVHYPVDVLCGALIGSLIGSLVWKMWRRRLLPEFIGDPQFQP